MDTNDNEISFDDKERRITPSNTIQSLIIKLQKALAHPGSKHFYLTINKYVKSKNLKKIVEYITNTCVDCQFNKVNNYNLRRYAGYLYS